MINMGISSGTFRHLQKCPTKGPNISEIIRKTNMKQNLLKVYVWNLSNLHNFSDPLLLMFEISILKVFHF